jgi:hypothetical protein
MKTKLIVAVQTRVCHRQKGPALRQTPRIYRFPTSRVRNLCLYTWTLRTRACQAITTQLVQRRPHQCALAERMMTLLPTIRQLLARFRRLVVSRMGPTGMTLDPDLTTEQGLTCCPIVLWLPYRSDSERAAGRCLLLWLSISYRNRLLDPRRNARSAVPSQYRYA